VAAPARAPAVIDTSSLINFLKIDQAQLLSLHPAFSFFVTDHVRGEVTRRYQVQFERLEAALRAGHLKETTVDTIEELQAFAELTALKRFGVGECAAIAAAFHRNWTIALDDGNAIKLIRRLYPEIPTETTPSIVVALIRANVITLAQADSFRDEWAANHRFRLPFRSFAEIL
jgi:predicted nucleic acid-binding protein